jgi:hypothetical protein
MPVPAAAAPARGPPVAPRPATGGVSTAQASTVLVKGMGPSHVPVHARRRRRPPAAGSLQCAA